MRITDVNNENVLSLGLCGYKNPKRPGFPEKIEWMNRQLENGLTIKTLVSEEQGNQGMIEYIPGEFAWRPVEAKGYLFIHCIFMGIKKEHKGKGLGSSLIEVVEEEAKKKKMKGVAIVTRKGSFMVGREIFLKRGYILADKAKPDFDLMALRFDQNSDLPKFKPGLDNRAAAYGDGLTIIRASQCPYTVKNVNEIEQVAKKEFGITPNIITLENHEQAQESPCPFGIFCVILNGEIVAHHPISKTRFVNIMNNLK